MTLVEAPLGYGKTTLITSWVETLRRKGTPIEYLSLDGTIGDQLQVLRKHLLALGIQVDDRDLSRDRIDTVCLVLDDFHEVDQNCRNFVQSLLRIAPIGLHLVVGSREPPGFPLTKLRMAEQVTDFTREDLRFTRDEARALFHEDLPADQLDAYLDHSEGWVAALQLLRQHDTDEEVPPDFDQVNKFADYLNEQYFERLDPVQQDLLLRTAIVERVDGDLANLLTERTDGWAQLGDLALANALIFEEETGSGTEYRYHQLLRDFLRTRQKLLGKTKLDHLHQQASKWFNDKGALFEAMHHACLAGNEALAEDLLIRSGGVLYGMLQGAGRLAPCLALLPTGRIYTAPRLMITQAYLLFKDGRLGDASDLLAEVRTKLSTGDVSLERELILIEAHARVYADTSLSPRQLDALEHAIAATPASDPLTRGMLCNFMCMFQIEIGNFGEARDFGDRAMSYYTDIDAAHLQFFMHLHLSAIDLETTTLAAARAGRDKALETLHDQFSYDTSLRAIADIYSGEAAFEAGQTHGLAKKLKTALDRVDRAEGWNMLYLAGYETCLSLLLEDGDLDGAVEICEQGGHLVNRRGMRLFSNQLTAFQLELAIRAGASQEAERLAQEVTDLLADADPASRLRWRGQTRSELALARYEMEAGAYDEAAVRIDNVVKNCRAIGAVRMCLRARMLHFLLTARQDHARASEQSLTAYLSEAARHGSFGAVVRDAGEFRKAALWVVTENGLGRFGTHQIQFLADCLWHTSEAKHTMSANIMSELLTDKELGVLTELTKGSANKVIARALEVTEPTVKFHLQNIYRKLGVNSRKLAIEIAKRCGVRAEEAA